MELETLLGKYVTSKGEESDLLIELKSSKNSVFQVRDEKNKPVLYLKTIPSEQCDEIGLLNQIAELSAAYLGYPAVPSREIVRIRDRTFLVTKAANMTLYERAAHSYQYFDDPVFRAIRALALFHAKIKDKKLKEVNIEDKMFASAVEFDASEYSPAVVFFAEILENSPKRFCKDALSVNWVCEGKNEEKNLGAIDAENLGLRPPEIDLANLLNTLTLSQDEPLQLYCRKYFVEFYVDEFNKFSDDKEDFNDFYLRYVAASISRALTFSRFVKSELSTYGKGKYMHLGYFMIDNVWELFKGIRERDKDVPNNVLSHYDGNKDAYLAVEQLLRRIQNVLGERYNRQFGGNIKDQWWELLKK